MVLEKAYTKQNANLNIVMESYLMYSIRRAKTSTCRISRRRIEALAISTIWTNYQRLATKRIFPQPIFKNLNGDDNVDKSMQSYEFTNLESYLISLLDLVRVLPLSEQWTQIIIARCF